MVRGELAIASAPPFDSTRTGTRLVPWILSTGVRRGMAPSIGSRATQC